MLAACSPPSPHAHSNVLRLNHLFLRVARPARRSLCLPLGRCVCRRAYFQSAHPPESVGERIAHVRQRWSVVTGPGDVLWVPTWTWHRVDYLDGVTALSASLFHPRHEQIVSHNPLYAALVLPNMLKELVGWKTQ